jgi:hypothetical protein
MHPVIVLRYSVPLRLTPLSSVSRFPLFPLPPGAIAPGTCRGGGLLRPGADSWHASCPPFSPLFRFSPFNSVIVRFPFPVLRFRPFLRSSPFD